MRLPAVEEDHRLAFGQVVADVQVRVLDEQAGARSRSLVHLHVDLPDHGLVDEDPRAAHAPVELLASHEVALEQAHVLGQAPQLLVHQGPFAMHAPVRVAAAVDVQVALVIRQAEVPVQARLVAEHGHADHVLEAGGAVHAFAARAGHQRIDPPGRLEAVGEGHVPVADQGGGRERGVLQARRDHRVFGTPQHEQVGAPAVRQRGQDLLQARQRGCPDIHALPGAEAEGVEIVEGIHHVLGPLAPDVGTHQDPRSRSRHVRIRLSLAFPGRSGPPLRRNRHPWPPPALAGPCAGSSSCCSWAATP